jgi:two-component system chemotaxis response regulator CheY
MNEYLHTLLIVDDSATTRTMIKHVLEMTGLLLATPLEAENGAQALEQLRSHKIDLVMTDLSMPVMGGSELIERMRNEPAFRSTPVVVISAQPDSEQIKQLKKKGVIGYLSKPFTAETVRDFIGPILDPQLAAPAAPPPVQPGLHMTLAEAVGDALETMAFIAPDLSEQTTLTGTDLRTVTVHFKGADVSGDLTLATSARFGVIVSGNCGNGESEAEGDDALKELANVTCGLLLRCREDRAKGFELSPPVLQLLADSSNLFTGEDSVMLEAEGYQLAAHVSVRGLLFNPEGGLT